MSIFYRNFVLLSFSAIYFHFTYVLMMMMMMIIRLVGRPVLIITQTWNRERKKKIEFQMEKKNFESIFLLFETNKNCFLNVFLFTTQSFIIIICFYVKKKFWMDNNDNGIFEADQNKKQTNCYNISTLITVLHNKFDLMMMIMTFIHSMDQFQSGHTGKWEFCFYYSSSSSS